MRKFLVFFLSLQLAFFSPFASAYFDKAKYAKNSNVKAGANSAFGYSIIKNANGQPELWSGLKRTAKPSAMAKLYKNFGPTLAFGAAVTAILGAVDWVMDPENNRVIYTPPPSDKPYKFRYVADGKSWVEVPPIIDHFDAQPEFERYTFERYSGAHTPDSNNWDERSADMQPCESRDLGTFNLIWTWSSFLKQERVRVYSETPCFTEEAYLGFEEIGAEVIKKANASDSDAQNDTHKANDPETWEGQEDPNGDPEPELTKNAKPYPCSVKEGAPNSCFDATKSDPDDPTTNKPDDSGDPEPAAKVELPAFCDWAKPACNFFVNSLNQSRTFFAGVMEHFGKVDEVITDIQTPEASDVEFTEAETQEPEPPLDLPVVAPVTFSTPSACPANPQINFSLGRVAASIDIPVHLVCYVAELIRPFVIAGGYLTGASILFRGRES